MSVPCFCNVELNAPYVYSKVIYNTYSLALIYKYTARPCKHKSFFLHYILSPSPIISIRCYQLQDKKASVVDTTDLLCGTEKLNIK